jgi:hypothetical protein
MLSAGFELAIAAFKRLHTYALHGTARRIGVN